MSSHKRKCEDQVKVIQQMMPSEPGTRAVYEASTNDGQPIERWTMPIIGWALIHEHGLDGEATYIGSDIEPLVLMRDGYPVPSNEYVLESGKDETWRLVGVELPNPNTDSNPPTTGTIASDARGVSRPLRVVDCNPHEDRP